MLVKLRALKTKHMQLATTPLLIPSFSSKGFPDLNEIVDFARRFITDVALVSSYDLFYQHISGAPTFPELVFLDSGGYEASKDREFSDLGYSVHEPKPWNEYFHRVVLEAWPRNIRSVFVSYDHPNVRFSVGEQAARARGSIPGRDNAARLLLIKPEDANQAFIKVEAITDKIALLAQFDAIGITEKELGPSVLQRMLNIARLRQSMTASGINIPIQIFGSLDTLSTPLYYLAGADIFDGLTWLRFAYSNGYTAYRNNYGALRFGIEEDDDLVKGASWKENLYYLQSLQKQMADFAGTSDFGCFQDHGSFLKSAQEKMILALGG